MTYLSKIKMGGEILKKSSHTMLRRFHEIFCKHFYVSNELYFSKLSRETSRWTKIQMQLRKVFDSIVAITDYGHIKAKSLSL